MGQSREAFARGGSKLKRVTHHLRTALRTAIDVADLLVGWGGTERGGRGREVEEEEEEERKAVQLM